MERRVFCAGILASAAVPSLARAEGFGAFLADLQDRAAADGIPAAVIQAQLSNLVPNADVLRLDQHQPEFTLSWATYSSRVLNAARVAQGQAKAQSAGTILAAVNTQYGVDEGVLLGIWGIETNYGTTMGNFNVVDALTTLAWDRQSSFFGGQVIDALRIITAGDAPGGQLIGSYAGAMGQPQFMPGVYLSTAVSFSGTGPADLWGSDADTLASMANYLLKAGWQPGLPSSEPVYAPPGFNLAAAGRENVRTIGYWEQFGVQRLAGAADLADSTPAALLLPDGDGGQAFLVYANFRVVRKYNPSDYYALAVGSLGRMVLAA
jgi:membrane-bound lytic murein transglycosylase B